MNALTIMKRHSALLLFFIMIYGAARIHISNDRPYAKVSSQDVERNFNIPFLKAISMGHKSLLADMFWIQTMIESDIEHYKNQDLGSWMYMRFNTVTELAPKFLEAYQWGSQYLMIVKDDILGSRAILKKGLKAFPHDYELNYYMGFLHMSELKDPKSAISYFEKVMFYPRSPAFLPALVAKLKYQQGLSKQEYIVILKDLYNRSKKRKRIRNYLERKIKGLEKAP